MGILNLLANIFVTCVAKCGKYSMQYSTKMQLKIIPNRVVCECEWTVMSM